MARNASNPNCPPRKRNDTMAFLGAQVHFEPFWNFFGAVVTHLRDLEATWDCYLLTPSCVVLTIVGITGEVARPKSLTAMGCELIRLFF